MTQVATITGRRRRTAQPLAAALAVLVTATLPSHASETDPMAVLRGMADFLAGQQVLSIRYDSDIEVITPELQKFQFTASGDVLLDRKAGMRLSRRGGYADVELIADRKAVTLFNRFEGRYVTVNAAGALEEVIERLRNEHRIEIPGADLLAADVFARLSEDIITAKYIGHGVVDDVECLHLAFRNRDTDWQIWVEIGAKPIPRKYVITSKTMAQAPQYTLRIRDFRTDVKPEANAFSFRPPEGTTSVALGAIGNVDEVPFGVVIGGPQK